MENEDGDFPAVLSLDAPRNLLHRQQIRGVIARQGFAARAPHYYSAADHPSLLSSSAASPLSHFVDQTDSAATAAAAAALSARRRHGHSRNFLFTSTQRRCLLLSVPFRSTILRLKQHARSLASCSVSIRHV
jgi:hypothetical protein